MSSSKPDKQFWDMADSFIAIANEHMADVPASRVSAAFLYAASRFNAFVVSARATSRDEFASDKEEAVAYFLEQYEKMLRENLEDHLSNFDEYQREAR